MSVRRVLASVAGLLLAASLVSCSGSTPGGSPTGPRSGTGSGGSAKPGHLTVSDATGQVRLKTAATRVVAIGWTYAEDLLAVGVVPVGIADKEGYAAWVGAGPRPPAEVEDVGRRESPDIDAIEDLDPDLIITDSARSAGKISQLGQIAPVLTFDPYRADMSAWQEMRTTFAEVAKAVNRSDRAAAVLARLDATLSTGRRTLAEGGKAEMPFALAQGASHLGVPTIRLYTRTSLASEVLERLGLQNAWKGTPDPQGLSSVDVGVLSSVSMADFLYVADRRDDPFTGMVAQYAAWKDLEFVRSARVHALDPRTQLTGGPLSSARQVREVVRALT